MVAVQGVIGNWCDSRGPNTDQLQLMFCLGRPLSPLCDSGIGNLGGGQQRMGGRKEAAAAVDTGIPSLRNVGLPPLLLGVDGEKNLWSSAHES